MANELQKLPPQNIEAEQSLLGSLLIDKDAMFKVADIVVPEDFYKNTHAMVYEAMRELFSRHEPIDILSLSNLLDERKQLEAIGGRTYLIHLANTVPTSSHIVSYANIVGKKATLRRLITAASDIAELGFHEEENVEEVLDTAEKKMFAVSQKFLHQSFTPLKDILHEAFERIDELQKEKGKLRGVPTGFGALDNVLAGLQRSDLVILAARPSVGKTSLAMDIARHVAVKEKIPVGIFSLEMSKEQLVDRLICSEGNIDLWKLRTGHLSEREDENDFARLSQSLSSLAEAPLYIDDSATSNVMEIRAKSRRLQAERGLGLLIIDYLQLMESRGNIENRVQEVADITRNLKAIARELNVPVLALSQLSRATETRIPAIPKLSDLRESGSIEQDSDVVMFIYRKAMDRGLKKELSDEEKHIAEIHIAKHRNGPTGIVELYFDANRVNFKNLEKRILDTSF